MVAFFASAPALINVYNLHFIHIKGKWQFIMRTVDNVGKLFQPIEDIITEKLIPALTDRSHCSIEERKLLSLPTRYGGLNIVNPVEEASLHRERSLSP